MSENIQSQSPVVVTPVEVKLLDTKQAAEVLQVSTRTVQNLIASGQLRSIHVGRSRRIPTDALDEFARGGVAVVNLPEENLQDFIRDLRLGTARVHGRENLLEILSAHQIENARRASGDTASPAYFENLRLIYARLLTYTEKHIRRLDSRKAAGVKATKDERKATRLLTAAFESFDAAIEESKSRGQAA
jgi:excisionase family DNA binding protein